MHKNDIVRLRHMLDASREILTFIRGKTRNDLNSDRMLTLSIVKSLEIIGEAASKTSEDCRRELPDMPWSSITNMRNRLIHAYYDINLDTVWQTVMEDVPPLISALEKVAFTDETS